ncbi:dTDP-4-dehydrorhamnose reductase [Robiginitalea myxolifaciens]|uniref:dTDP-4-dehydrorhamnose reductase n=1 Tax=Robiginitalea myxolifaciens TaxID=400055 RepID=A0A1I6G2T2_9FLAO|nr:dTDP-4-dehydrorhamnose reductase [Robiginitalea myxolifaciens]SFR36441.1 dTDP-4-dehydrorhamnose reductase [Robiginitalea myxolifaciens]
MIRVAISGAGGQLARALEDVSGAYPEISAFFFDRNHLDITSLEIINAVHQEVKPDYWINCAAYTQVDLAEKFPQEAMQVNGLGPGYLARVCRDSGSTLIHISTDYVFDGKKEGGYYPEDQTNPINVYGKTKLAGEEAIRSILERYFIIRTSWLYSRKHGPNFYTKIRDRARNGDALEITDTQRGCPTEAESLARFLLDLVRSGSDKYGIYHYTNGEAMTWFDFAKRILQEEGLLEETRLQRVQNYRTLAERPQTSILLSGKAQLPS